MSDEVTIAIPAGTKRFEIVEMLTIHDQDGSAPPEDAGEAEDSRTSLSQADSTEDDDDDEDEEE